ncbi:MAG: phosphatidylserine decarboxylase family protein [Bacteroidota bacterium]|nr:phosphatidylserine decarboxylase family protein [Bacteroidota bacterium]
MTIHKEGYKILFFSLIIGIGLVLLLVGLTPGVKIFHFILYFVYLLILLLFLQFFRNPKRKIVIDDNNILCPADGKVVVIEEVMETEYFNEKRRQISIFMSPFNVHANWYPVNGIVKYYKYHPGLFLVAYNPKSSTANERTTIVVENEGAKKVSVLFRQIAGILARRIVCYAKEGNIAKQTEQFGFIKFGSRIDLLLPLNYKINIKLGQKVKAGMTVIATVE